MRKEIVKAKEKKKNKKKNEKKKTNTTTEPGFPFFIDLISLAFSHFSYAKRTASLPSSVTPDIQRLWKAYPFERNPTSWVPSHPHGYSPGESFPRSHTVPFLNPSAPNRKSLSHSIFDSCHLSFYLVLSLSLPPVFGIHLLTYNFFLWTINSDKTLKGLHSA